MYCLDPVTKACVSTGNHADVIKDENIKLLQLLVEMSLNGTGIRMPAGMDGWMCLIFAKLVFCG